MRRALAVGFGLAIAFGTAMYACGGDDTTTGGGAGTSSGTAGTTSGAAGSTSGTAGAGATGVGGASGTGGASSGVGGGIPFDASFDLDALAGLLGNYTCAQLTACCPLVPAQAQSGCNQVVAAANDMACSAAMTGYKLAGYCK